MPDAISPDPLLWSIDPPPVPPPDPRSARLAALRAAFPGALIVLLAAGEEQSVVSFGAKVPDAAEWAIIATDLAAGNAAAAELALRRAVVGATPEESVAERARLEAILNEDPPLGDYWGMQLLQLVGQGAKVTTSPAADAPDLYELRAEMAGGEVVALRCKRRSRPQWNMLRDIGAKKGPRAFGAAAYELLVLGADKADVAARYPALVEALGDAAASAGSRAGAGAPFGLAR